MFEGLSTQEVNDMKALLAKSGSANYSEAMEAQKAIAAAIVTPIRQAILVGDTVLDLFDKTEFDPHSSIEYPMDFVTPDNVHEFTAYTIPTQGRIPERQIQSDKIQVKTYDVGSSIDWLLRYAQEARWDVVSRAIEVFEAGFTKKLNDDSWHTILAAGFDRNIVVNDSNAAAGQFTKRLVSLMKLVMRRNAGGNSGSMNRGRLTHLFVSPEALEDMRNWGIDQVDEVTRREIYLADDTGAASVFGVKVVALDELGEGQEYQDYYQNVIATGAANNGMAASDVELVIGIDATRNDAFVMPIRENLQVFEDPYLHRQRRAGIYGWMSVGVAVLSNTKVLLGSL